MNMQNTIEKKLREAPIPEYLAVENESGSHNVPSGSESHFKVTIVSEGFTDLRLLHRHRSVNKLLAEELAGTVHALALHTYTPEEWRQREAKDPDSPPCHGANQAES